MWSPQAVLQLQPCILQVNLILTLSAWRWWQTPQVKGSVLQEALHPAPNTLQRQVVSLGCPLSFWPSWYRLEAPMTPSLGSINLLEQFMEVRETFYLRDHQFVIKGYNSRKAWWRRCTGQGMGESVEFPCPLQACDSPHPHVFNNPEALHTLSSLHGGPIHKHNWLNLCP